MAHTQLASHRAPLTLKLIVRINQVLAARGLTREQFRDELNKLLPPRKQIKATHSGTVALNRWLHPTGNDWSEPRGEIVLAMQKYLELNSPQDE